MKRILLAVVAVIVCSALAVCGPYFGVENAGRTLEPEFVVGADIGGRIGGSGWTLGVDASLTDPNLLTLVDWWIIGLDVSGEWGAVAKVNDTGSLTYGCMLTVNQALELDPGSFDVGNLGLELWTVALCAEGYVGPFSAWIGCDFEWDVVHPTTVLTMTPVVGFFVHW